MKKRVRLTKPLQTSKIEVIVAHACVVAIRENDEDHKWRKKMETVTKKMKLVECGLCEQFIDMTTAEINLECLVCKRVFCAVRCTSKVFCTNTDHIGDINWDPICINCENAVSLSGFKICSECGDIMKK